MIEIYITFVVQDKLNFSAVLDIHIVLLFFHKFLCCMFLHVYHLQPVPMNRTKYKADQPPSDRPPEVPARPAIPPLKQNQACIRTVSAPESPRLTATEHPPGANIQSVKNQEVKPSVVTNLKNLKKKFHKKRCMSQELMYTEIDLKATGRSGDTESEYQEITDEVTSSGSPFPSTFTDVSLTDEGLPHEYLPPPPFAPGYWYTTAPLLNTDGSIGWSENDCRESGWRCRTAAASKGHGTIVHTL